jgi:hypothetical protein
MAKTQGKVDDRGRVRSGKVVKGQRHIDPEWDVHTFKEGPLQRLFSR